MVWLHSLCDFRHSLTDTYAHNHFSDATKFAFTNNITAIAHNSCHCSCSYNFQIICISFDSKRSLEQCQHENMHVFSQQIHSECRHCLIHQINREIWLPGILVKQFHPLSAARKSFAHEKQTKSYNPHLFSRKMHVTQAFTSYTAIKNFLINTNNYQHHNAYEPTWIL